MFLRRRIFSKPSGPLKQIVGTFPDHEGLVAQLAELRFDVALHHPHGGHDHDDGEHADQHAQQRQGRAQLVRGQGAHGHAEALAELGQQDGYAFGEHADFTPRSAAHPPGSSAPRARPGQKPDNTPVTSDTSSAMPTTVERQGRRQELLHQQRQRPGDAQPDQRRRADRCVAASIRNCSRMVRRLAPMALRMPISRVRSATETNMMFMMPMPPTNSDRPVMNRPIAAMVAADLVEHLHESGPAG